MDCTVGRNEGCSVEVGAAEDPTGHPVGFNVTEGVAVGLVGYRVGALDGAAVLGI